MTSTQTKIVVGLILIAIPISWYIWSLTTPTGPTTPQLNNLTPVPSENSEELPDLDTKNEESIEEEVTSAPPTEPTQPLPVADNSIFTGTKLAGTTTPLLDFTAADYERALTSNKTIVLYFYANWCPICRVEFPLAEDAFDELNLPNTVGFRVNFNDNQTDQFEESLAKQYGVAYQHTKVIVKNGIQVLKSPESWDKDRYIEVINQY